MRYRNRREVRRCREGCPRQVGWLGWEWVP